MISDAQEGITNINWSVYGKILDITKTGDPNVNKIIYEYDAGGNRIGKRVKVSAGNSDTSTTWYVRDASGNVMATYEMNVTGASFTKKYLNEQHLYGSSRLGIYSVQKDLTLNSPATVAVGIIGQADTSKRFVRGKKFFELSNHLGNVLATISDRKLQVAQAAPNGGLVSYYKAIVVTANDYYPFGMGMVGRSYQAASSAYRYGFNGKEKDPNITTDAYDFGARIYDSRVGRWMSVDPLASEAAAWTPYRGFFNSPIINIDPTGMFEYQTNEKDEVLTRAEKKRRLEIMKRIVAESKVKMESMNDVERKAFEEASGMTVVEALKLFDSKDKTITLRFGRWCQPMDEHDATDVLAEPNGVGNFSTNGGTLAFFCSDPNELDQRQGISNKNTITLSLHLAYAVNAMMNAEAKTPYSGMDLRDDYSNLAKNQKGFDIKKDVAKGYTFMSIIFIHEIVHYGAKKNKLPDVPDYNPEAVKKNAKEGKTERGWLFTERAYGITPYNFDPFDAKWGVAIYATLKMTNTLGTARANRDQNASNEIEQNRRDNPDYQKRIQEQIQKRLNE